MDIKQFDHTYLINLDKRPDRLQHASLQLSTLSIEYERFPAIDGDFTTIDWKADLKYINVPHYGWNKYSAALSETTRKLILDAKEKKYEHILIFEDDIKFEPDATSILEKAVFPNVDWHFFYFGAYHQERPSYYNETVIQLNNSLCLHAYAIHASIFDDYLEKLEKRDMPIDWVVCTHFQPLGKCFALRNPIARQYPNFSDIKQTEVNYNNLFIDLTN